MHFLVSRLLQQHVRPLSHIIVRVQRVRVGPPIRRQDTIDDRRVVGNKMIPAAWDGTLDCDLVLISSSCLYHNVEKLTPQSHWAPETRMRSCPLPVCTVKEVLSLLVVGPQGGVDNLRGRSTSSLAILSTDGSSASSIPSRRILSQSSSGPSSSAQ